MSNNTDNKILTNNNKMEFVETINIENCKKFINVNYEQFLDYFNVEEWENNKSSNDKTKYTSKTYYKYIKKNIKKIIKKNKKNIKKRYKYALGQKSGRLYVDTFGIQSVPCDLKKYLLDGCKYTDYDMINAHFVILNHLTTDLDVDNDYLNNYIENRRKILKDNQLSKIDVIVCLYSDKYNGSNEFLKELHKELDIIKDKVNAKFLHCITPKKKSKNPKSSTLSYILNHFENTYIQKVAEKYKVSVPYFDGFLSTDKINIKDLNKITEEENIKWSIKDMTNNINLDELLKSPEQKILDYFDNLDGCGENDIAERFLNLLGEDKNKYILYRDGDKSNYYYYNKYNILIDCGRIPPSSLNQEITTVLKNDLKYYQSQAVLLLDEDEEKITRKIYDYWNKQFQKNSFKKSIVDELKYFIEDSELFDKIDSNNDLLAFKNEVFDFKKGKFREIKRSDYILTHLSYERPDYNDNIRIELMNMLLSIFDTSYTNDKKYDFNDKTDDAIIRTNYFLDTIAYPLFTNKFEKFNIWTGCGSNGKGILLALLEKTYDKYFKIADSKFLTSKIKGGAANPDLADCKGKKIVMVSEPECDGDNEIKFNVETIKKITGRDSITTRYLNKNSFTFTPIFTLFCQCNQIPTIEKNDNAMIRRLEIMEFLNKFVDKPLNKNEKKIDRTLKDKLKKPEYYQQFMLMLIYQVKDKYDVKQIVPPKSVQNKTDEYFENNNIIKEWLSYEYNITNDNDSFILMKELYDEFKNGDEFQGMSKKDFKYNMKSNGFNYTRNQKKTNSKNKPMVTGRGYFGIELKKRFQQTTIPNISIEDQF